MIIKKTDFEGLLEISSPVFSDTRGYFKELYNQELFIEHGIEIAFAQDNLSWSKKGTIRGLHLQLPPYGQIKFVSVLKGKVLDIALDLRQQSDTFGKVYQKILEPDGESVLIPAGFAHGFAVIEDSLFHYKCSSPYNKNAERGILYNDPELNINWRTENPLVSEKDKILPTFKRFLESHTI